MLLGLIKSSGDIFCGLKNEIKINNCYYDNEHFNQEHQRIW